LTAKQDEWGQLWKDVAADPTEHALLAKKLRIPELYCDAIRHMASQAYALDCQIGLTNSTGGNWGAIAEIMGLEEVEVRNIFPWQLHDVITNASGNMVAGDAKLEGKGWHEWQTPYFAMFHSSSVVNYPTFMAVPSFVPWEDVGKTKNPWKNLKRKCSVEDASDEWMGLLAELLGRK
jgi:hypothetical protein